MPENLLSCVLSVFKFFYSTGAREVRGHMSIGRYWGTGATRWHKNPFTSNTFRDSWHRPKEENITGLRPSWCSASWDSKFANTLLDSWESKFADKLPDSWYSKFADTLPDSWDSKSADTLPDSWDSKSADTLPDNWDSKLKLYQTERESQIAKAPPDSWDSNFARLSDRCYNKLSNT